MAKPGIAKDQSESFGTGSESRSAARRAYMSVDAADTELREGPEPVRKEQNEAVADKAAKDADKSAKLLRISRKG